MGFDKQELIKGYLRTIEQNEEKIIEYSKSCDSSKRRIRALERDLLKKRNKELRKLRNWKMNKQELIERIKKLDEPYLKAEFVLELVKQLDEPKPVKVPQCVADWISFVKTNGLKFKNTYGFYEEIAPSDDVYRVMYYIFKESIADKGIRKWVADNIDTFARAWLDGYEVEEEKRYLVKIKATKHYLVKDGNGKIFFSLAFKGYFTKKELEEADFGWVFDCPGIEIEEVEV